MMPSRSASAAVLPDDPRVRPCQYRQSGQVRAVEQFSVGLVGVESQEDIGVWSLNGGR